VQVGDLVEQIYDFGYKSDSIGVVTQENRARGIVFVHFRDKAHWIMSSLVKVVNESR
jgi:hypothetical protein